MECRIPARIRGAPTGASRGWASCPGYTESIYEVAPPGAVPEVDTKWGQSRLIRDTRRSRYKAEGQRRYGDIQTTRNSWTQSVSRHTWCLHGISGPQTPNGPDLATTPSWRLSNSAVITLSEVENGVKRSDRCSRWRSAHSAKRQAAAGQTVLLVSTGTGYYSSSMYCDMVATWIVVHVRRRASRCRSWATRSRQGQK